MILWVAVSYQRSIYKLNVILLFNHHVFNKRHVIKEVSIIKSSGEKEVYENT